MGKRAEMHMVFAGIISFVVPFSGALNIGYCFGVICYVILFDIKIGTTTASTSANHVSQLSLSEASPQNATDYKDFAADASWRSTRFGHESYLLIDEHYLSPWVVHVPGARLVLFSGISCTLYSLDSLEI